MRILRQNSRTRRGNEDGSSLVEVLVGVGLFGITFVSLFGGISLGLGLTRQNAEQLRAAQVLTEKMELIRACTWNQVTNGYCFIPQTFTATLHPAQTSDPQMMLGEVTIAEAPVSESYRTSLREITVSVTWNSEKATRSRSMKTLVSAYGNHPSS